MSEHDKHTTTLNTLIATLLDSVDGYTKAGQDIDRPELAERFNARARERQSAVAGLQAAVASLGGNPEPRDIAPYPDHATELRKAA